jgi:hypothetical protein
MIKKILIAVIIGLIIYSAYIGIEPYYGYMIFKSDVEEYVKVAIDQPKWVRAEIFSTAESYDIPIKPEDIKLDRKPGQPYKVRVSWEKTVDFFTLYQYTWSFTIDTTKW